MMKSISGAKTEFNKQMAKCKPALEGMDSKDFAGTLVEVFNQNEIRKGEIPSANCHGSARGMAKLASVMANKGERGSGAKESAVARGHLISKHTWIKMHDGEKLAIFSHKNYADIHRSLKGARRAAHPTC